jgi:predicted SnoaL-like aldol condensation-catalyzing enzyme
MKMLISAIAVLATSALAYAAEPVMATKDQAALLKSNDPQLAANKKLVYDMWRAFLNAHHIDEADKYLAPEYHQHNPNAVTGLEGVKAYFRAQNMKPMPIPDEIQGGLVTMVAERDLVVLAFRRDMKDKDGNPYTSTWFDMFRIKDGKIVEHWDTALKP